jgi:hypothetical protein
LEFSTGQWLAIVAIFVWSGFVRSGIGFGGAALGLPLLLLVEDQPLVWLPIIGVHLLVFTTLTAGGRMRNIDWGFVRWSMTWMIIPKLAGVIGLLSLPTEWMVVFVFSISAAYAVAWIAQREVVVDAPWFDRLLLVLGGYVSGASLVGAPLIAAVAIRKVVLTSYRDTLFVLWFLLVTIKMTAFISVGIDLHFAWALLLLIPAGMGHVVGLRFHERLVHGDSGRVKRLLGSGLLLVSLGGLIEVFWRP